MARKIVVWIVSRTCKTNFMFVLGQMYKVGHLYAICVFEYVQ